MEFDNESQGGSGEDRGLKRSIDENKVVKPQFNDSGAVLAVSSIATPDVLPLEPSSNEPKRQKTVDEFERLPIKPEIEENSLKEDSTEIRKELRLLSHGSEEFDWKLNGNYWAPPTSGMRRRRGICGAVEHVSREVREQAKVGEREQSSGNNSSSQIKTRVKEFQVDTRYVGWCTQLSQVVEEVATSFVATYAPEATAEKEALEAVISSIAQATKETPQESYRTMAQHGLEDVERVVGFLKEVCSTSSSIVNQDSARQEAIGQALLGLSQWGIEAPELSLQCGVLHTARVEVAEKASGDYIASEAKLALLEKAATEEDLKSSSAIEESEARVQKLEKEEAELMKRLEEVRCKLDIERRELKIMTSMPAKEEYTAYTEKRDSLVSIRINATQEATLMASTQSYLKRLSSVAQEHYLAILSKEIQFCEDAMKDAEEEFERIRMATSAEENTFTLGDEFVILEGVEKPIGKEGDAEENKLDEWRRLNGVARKACVWLERMKVVSIPQTYNTQPSPLSL